MKKYLFIITSALLLTACSCNNEPDGNTTISTGDGTEAGATEASSSVNDIEETTASLPDGMAYQMEDGSYISIDSLLSPMNHLNSICQGTQGDITISSIYPEILIDSIIEFSEFESAAEYETFMHETYVQLYGEEFSIANEYVACSLLSEDDLSDLSSFYKEHFYAELTPTYGFVIESNCKVTYIDEEGNEQEDSSYDYYIAYCMDDIIYLDYFFVDTLDL